MSSFQNELLVQFVNVNNSLNHIREDLISTIIVMKKEHHFLEIQMSQLKAENQRAEAENLKQHRRIEKILSSSGQTNMIDVRKEIEKTSLCRQLKAQVNKCIHSFFFFFQTIICYTRHYFISSVD